MDDFSQGVNLIGPIEVLIVSFPGNKFKGEIIPELKELVENSTIQVIDIVLVVKDKLGETHIIEISDFNENNFPTFDPVVADITGVLSDYDIEQFARSLKPNSSAAMMIYENTWARRFTQVVADADGEVILSERIPKRVVKELITELRQKQPAKAATN